jgi:hypothetical protein
MPGGMRHSPKPWTHFTISSIFLAIHTLAISLSRRVIIHRLGSSFQHHSQFDSPVQYADNKY